ncbi:MAG: SxtJ family membrane protein [Bacteroidota bacterium]
MHTKPPTKQQLNVFVAGLCIILVLLSQKSFRTGRGSLSLVLLGLAITLLILYLIKRYFVIQFYVKWMRVASCIGAIVTSIAMVVLFYFIFTPIAIVLRLLKKDVLNLRIEPKQKTYWLERPQKEFKKEDYERQF